LGRLEVQKRQGRRQFGKVRELTSGRHQASYQGPDRKYYTARRDSDGGPLTFDSYGDADGWLADRQSEIRHGKWAPPGLVSKQQTFASYSAKWLAERKLADKTREGYQLILDKHLNPAFGDKPVAAITPALVREWHASPPPKPQYSGDRRTGESMRAHAYRLLSSIMRTAVTDGLLPVNPCSIWAAGQDRAVHEPRPATLDELEIITENMPARLQLMVLLAAWCGLRYGELAELRRSDIDLAAGMVRVSRGAVKLKGARWKVKGPKTPAGIRSVGIPPFLLATVVNHLSDYVPTAADALLFPASRTGAAHLDPGSVRRHFKQARTAAARPDLRFHDLRHTGATLTAATGATLAELMRRLGHSTPRAAMRYQHATDDRETAIASALGEFHGAKVVRLRPRSLIRVSS
jgi:integrase